MKRTKRVAAWLLAFVMVLTATLSAAPATVSAKSATVKSITVKSSLSGSKKKVYVAKGKTVKLSTTVKVTPNKKANKKVTYKSKNTKIATVNAKGVVKGVKAGNTKITVTSKTDKKKKTTIKVKVTKAPVKKVKMTSASAVLNKGASLKLKAKVTAKKGAVKTLKWKSSNKKVATVSQKGVVKAVAAGTATITAAAIDGSGKKATCKITVSDAVNLTGMTIQNGYTISFSLNKAKALTSSQVTLKAKSLANGAYRGNIKLESLTTNDKINYTLILENSLSIGDYAQLSIPSLTGTKTLERQYLKAVCAFTDDYTCSARVGENDSWYFGFDEGIGYSQFSISGLPAGLKAESYSRGLKVSGTPTKAGVTKAVLKAVDEVGDTLTQNVYFVIGSDKVLAGAAAPVYTLASDNNTYGSYPRVSGGSGYYTYQITADPQGTGATIDSDGEVHVSLKVPGTYKVTVKVTDGNNPALSCNVTMEYHVAQGVSIGGCVRDAQGNPLNNVSIRFTNQNRANRYCTYEYASTDVTGVYSAVVAAGVYDIIVGRSYDSEAASATHYVTGQSLTASRTGYDFSLPLYKVSLVSSNTDISDSIGDKDWYINDEYVGYGSTLYLKAGNYTLISDSESGDRNETNSGSWFDGLTKTISYSEANLTASVNVANKAVQTTVRKVTAGTSSSRVYRYPAAKNTSSNMYVDDGEYSLPWEDYTLDGDYWDEVQTALKLEITEAGTYRLGSDYGSVKLFNSDGQVVEPSDDSYEKTYENLQAGTYFVGTGDYDIWDYSVYVNSVSEENTSSAVESSAAEDTDALRDDIEEEYDDAETIATEESSVSEGIAVE